MFNPHESAPEVIMFNFQKTEAEPKLMPERTRVRFGKSIIPPVLFLQDEGLNDEIRVDGLFMKTLLSDRFQSVRIED